MERRVTEKGQIRVRNKRSDKGSGRRDVVNRPGMGRMGPSITTRKEQNKVNKVMVAKRTSGATCG